MTVNDIIYQINSTTQYTPITADCDKYWHIQMHLPEGKGGTEIDSSLMLLEAEPIIGTGEWDNFQCKDFKEIDNGNIVLVRKAIRQLRYARFAVIILIMKNLQTDI